MYDEKEIKEKFFNTRAYSLNFLQEIFSLEIKRPEDEEFVIQRNSSKMFNKLRHIFMKTHEALWKIQVCTVGANYLWNHNRLLNLKKKKYTEGQFDMYNFQIVISMNIEPSRQELHK